MEARPSARCCCEGCGLVCPTGIKAPKVPSLALVQSRMSFLLVGLVKALPEEEESIPLLGLDSRPSHGTV